MLFSNLTWRLVTVNINLSYLESSKVYHLSCIGPFVLWMLLYVHAFPVTYDFEKCSPDVVPCSKWTTTQTTAIKHMKATEGGNLSLACILSTSKNPRCTQPL